MELKGKKVDDKTTIYHDALTNDPVAVVKATDKLYGRGKTFHISWHPDFKKLYPAANDLRHMNFDSADKADVAVGRIENQYTHVANDRHRDPLRAEFVGYVLKHRPTNDSPEQRINYAQYNLHHKDGHIATMFVAKDKIHKIGLGHDNFKPGYRQSQGDIVHLEFTGEKPTKEQLEVSSKKHPGIDPANLLHVVNHWYENRTREPNFVGMYHHDNMKMFKTKLTPEDASAKYMEHMQSKPEFASHKFVRHSPTLFTATKKPMNESSYGNDHHIIDTSNQGTLMHSYHKYHHADHYSSKKLQEVIE